MSWFQENNLGAIQTILWPIIDLADLFSWSVQSITGVFISSKRYVPYTNVASYAFWQAQLEAPTQSQFGAEISSIVE